jgi:hypothetical protein
MDETEYWECETCCYAVSGYPSPRLNKRLDAHEQDTGHRMKGAVENE